MSGIFVITVKFSPIQLIHKNAKLNGISPGACTITIFYGSKYSKQMRVCEKCKCVCVCVCVSVKSVCVRLNMCVCKSVHVKRTAHGVKSESINTHTL